MITAKHFKEKEFQKCTPPCSLQDMAQGTIKWVLSLMCAILLWGCHTDKDDGLVDIIVDYRLVESNSMYGTKAIANEQVLFAISQVLPVQVNLTFKNSSGVSTTVKTGEKTKLAEGVYSVTGTSFGGQLGDQINANCYFTSVPYIVFSSSITVASGVSNYTVNGSFRSFAIVVDYDETLKAQYQNYQNQWKDVPFTTLDNVGLVFVQGSYSDIPLQLNVIPKDSKYEETSFSFSTNANTQRYTFVENGKFYKLHPALKGSSGSVVELGLPEFVEGTVKE